MNVADCIRPPSNRAELVNLYLQSGYNTSLESINRLEPAICARITNGSLFQSAPYNDLISCIGNDVSQITIKGKPVYWVKPESSVQLADAVNIRNISLSAPCAKRIAHIERSFENLSSLFPHQIEFITDFVSCIFWVDIKMNPEILVGSAAFSEVPHAVFFSDYGMYSLPPEIVVPHEHSSFAIFENLYHEALHHQMHVFSNLVTGGYLDLHSKLPEVIKLSWRDRDFTLLESLHALHIYSYVTPLRFAYLNHLNQSKNSSFCVKWLRQACFDGLRMWNDLSCELLKHIAHFKYPWKNLITEYVECYAAFSMNSHQLAGFAHEII